MNARTELASDVLRPMTVASLDGVMALEEAVYPFPWTRGNFLDSLASGYTAWTLNRLEGDLVGYCVAMFGAGEMHLSTSRWHRHGGQRGHARRLFEELVAVCRQRPADRLWLEVRESNRTAQEVYRRLGFVAAGMRRGYYPAPAGTREDAIVMTLDLRDGGRGHALD
jgi:ribosomal-protein-alanine N-acetyltransferase